MKIIIEVPDSTRAVSVSYVYDNNDMHMLGTKMYGTEDIEKLQEYLSAAKAIPVEWIIKQIQEQSLSESKAYSKLLRLWEKENE